MDASIVAKKKINQKVPLGRLAACCALILLCGVVAADKAAFVHPGIMHTAEDLAKIKAALVQNKQPLEQAWEALKVSDYARRDWQQTPFEHVQRGASNRVRIGSDEFLHDGTAAYTQALLWVFTDDTTYAQNCIDILNAWSATLKTVTGHDAKLLIGIGGIKYCMAAELMKYSEADWALADQQRFGRMLTEIWYPIIKDFYPSANGNWDASMMQTMMAMGIFLDDRAMFDRAVNYYFNGPGNGAIANYINEAGQCQESGRDQAHTQMGLEYLSNACEIAFKQGRDLYSACDNRLAKGFEYTARYNLGLKVPYTPYTSFQKRYHYPKISPKARGRLRSMYEKIYAHYQGRKGLKMPFTRQAIKKTRPEKGGISSIPWGTLMFAQMSQSHCHSASLQVCGESQ